MRCRRNARNNGRTVHDKRTGKAFGHKPVFQFCQYLCLIIGQKLDPDQDRRHAFARTFRQPVVREHLGLGRVKRPDGQPLAKGGIGHKFGVAFPFQIIAPDGPRKMRGIRLRMGRTVPVQKVKKMRAVRIPVAVGRIQGFLDCHINRMTRCLQCGKRARMQLIDQGISQGVIFDRGHV